MQASTTQTDVVPIHPSFSFLRRHSHAAAMKSLTALSQENIRLNSVSSTTVLALVFLIHVDTSPYFELLNRFRAKSFTVHDFEYLS